MSACVAVAVLDPKQLTVAETLAQKLACNIVPIDCMDVSYLLVVTESHLELRSVKSPSFKPIFVDFIGGKLLHRQQYGGGKGQLIAKAVGFQKHKHPTLIDATAGLGEDAFVLATLGADVLMLERSPVVAALLQDGLDRLHVVQKSFPLRLIETDSIAYLQNTVELPDVIFIDTMFPDTQKTALVKKEMRILRDLVGEDIDAEKLLSVALEKAKKRVVVKRPRKAPAIPGPEPTLVLSGKSGRFDVYIMHTF